MVTFEEFARRLCLANHRRDLDNAQPAERYVPCGKHRHEATAFWGLTQPAGAKSLAVVLDVASEPFAEGAPATEEIAGRIGVS